MPQDPATSAIVRRFQAEASAFRFCVESHDFPAAQDLLRHLSANVARNWADLAEDEQAFIHGDLMSLLEWARVSVRSIREQTRVEVERIDTAKVYRMPPPRPALNLQG